MKDASARNGDGSETENGTPRITKAVLEASDQKPPALAVDLGNIPPELKTRAQWVLWRFDRRREKNGKTKWTKLPINPATKVLASTTDPATWGTFETACKRYPLDGFDGVGFVFAGDDPFCGVDLDDCRDKTTGGIDQWAAEAIAELDSYAEVSPSGTGVKVFVRATVPPGRCRKGHVEMYDRGRYFCVTGQRLSNSPTKIQDRQEQVNRLHARLVAASPRPAGPQKPITSGPPEADAEIVALAMRAKNGAKFAALWSGDTGSYSSHSEADLALCGMLAFYAGPDPERIDRLFRASGLIREKWNEQHGDRTYGQRTIDTALGGRTEFYWSRGKGARRLGPVGAPATPRLPTDGEGAKETGYEIILAYFRERYNPVFRRGTMLYAGNLSRDVKVGEALLAAPIDLITRLEAAQDVPRAEGAVVRGKLPNFFRTWAPTAWTDMLAALPDEEHSGEVSDPAQEEFRAKLTAALCTIVPLAYSYRKGASDRDEVQRRPIIDWARRFAKAGRWSDVRGHRLWSRHDGASDGTPRRLRVALRVELFGQLHAADLARMTQRRFAGLCQVYGLGRSCRVKGGAERAVELDEGFVADLLAEPATEEDAIEQGDQDGKDGREADARART